jgi:hypothetical protein
MTPDRHLGRLSCDSRVRTKTEPTFHLAPQALLRCAVALQYLSDFSKKARPNDLARGSATGATELGPAPGPRRPLLPGAWLVAFAVRLLEEFSRSAGLVSRMVLLLSGLAAS